DFRVTGVQTCALPISYGNIGPYHGGDGGNGGQVTLDTSVSISTTGNDSHGIFVFSRSGSGGDGGDSILGSKGGKGGSARAGGTEIGRAAWRGWEAVRV